MALRILVVGAGFAGACYARTFADAGYAVDVIDRRDHIAGNAFDFVDHHGNRRHKYGPHLFHTNDESVVRWLEQFGTWIPYEHRVRALLSEHVYVPLPINLDTVNAFFSTGFATQGEIKAFLAAISIPIANPRNAGEYLDSKIGRELTDTFFRGYTKKMWALDLEELDVSVVRRIPIRFDRETRYFPNDRFQMLPVGGYHALFERILAHPNIQVQLETAFDRSMEPDYTHVFNSMPIDDYFDYQFGELPYRSIKFEHILSDEPTSRQWATTNFTDDRPYTRETNWHLLPAHRLPEAGPYVTTREEPCDYRDNDRERYYPVKTADARFQRRYERYRKLAAASERMTFIGRTGTYQYLDMHQVIHQSLTRARRWIEQHGGVAESYR